MEYKYIHYNTNSYNRGNINKEEFSHNLSHMFFNLVLYSRNEFLCPTTHLDEVAS